MSDNYTPRFFTKDGEVRLARTVDDYFSFQFDGWQLYEGEIEYDPSSRVITFNGRRGEVTLTIEDITATGFVGGGATDDPTIADIVAHGAMTRAAITAMITAAIDAVSAGTLDYPVDSYGAVGDGVTDDRAAFVAAFAAAKAAGGGKVTLGRGKRYGWTGGLTVPAAVMLIGTTTRQNLAAAAAPSVPGLVALSANAQLKVGDFTGNEQAGGASNVYIDGNYVGGTTTSLSKFGLVRYAGVNQLINNVFVVRSNGDGVVYDGLQNSTIVGGDSSLHKGTALVWDNGTGGLSISGGYYGTSKGGVLDCRDTAGEANLYPFGPSNITMTGAVLEAYAGQPAPLNENFTRHAHISGTALVFNGCNFTGGAANDAAATILIDAATTSFIPATVVFNSCTYWTRGGYDTIRIAGAGIPAVVSFNGQQNSGDNGSSHAASFVCADGGTPHVSMNGEQIVGGDVNGNLQQRSINGGGLSQFFTWRDGGDQYRLRAGQVTSFRREGDTGHRLYIDRNGTLGWFNGAPGPAIAYIQRGNNGAGSGLDFYTDSIVDPNGTFHFIGGDIHVDGDIFANGSATPLSGGGGGGSASAVDTLQLDRLERQARQKIDTCNRRVIARSQDATIINELWADASAWAGTAPTVSGGHMYNAAAALNRDISALGGVGKRVMFRAVGTIPASSSKYIYAGFSNDAAGAAPSVGGSNAIMIGLNSSNWGVLKGTNVTGALTNTPAGASPGAGDYIFTGIVDETGISLSIAPKTNPGQIVASTSILRSQMPGGTGAINNLILSDSDTTGTHYWGPLQIISDIVPPPKASQTPGGVALWGAANPIHINRRDPVTGIRHLWQIPGDYDPRVPMPVVMYLHPSVGYSAASVYSDTKMTGVLSSLLAAGYAVCASDNGPSPTAGGTQDKYGNQAGLDDYSALIEWGRQHLNTGAVCLLGGSQGGMFVQNILASRKTNAIGGIAAACSISPATDTYLVAQTQPFFTSLIEAAYSVSDLPGLQAALAATDTSPIDQTVGELRGVPQNFRVSTTDPTTPKASHVDPMVTKLGATVPEASVVTGGSIHLDPVLFDGPAITAFFDKYAK